MKKNTTAKQDTIHAVLSRIEKKLAKIDRQFAQLTALREFAKLAKTEERELMRALSKAPAPEARAGKRIKPEPASKV